MGQFRHHHSGKARTMALFWLRTSYHDQRYTFQCYMLRSLLTQSFNIVNTPVILLFSKKRVPGFAAEDNSYNFCNHIQIGDPKKIRISKSSTIYLYYFSF